MLLDSNNPSATSTRVWGNWGPATSGGPQLPYPCFIWRRRLILSHSYVYPFTVNKDLLSKTDLIKQFTKIPRARLTLLSNGKWRGGMHPIEQMRSFAGGGQLLYSSLEVRHHHETARSSLNIKTHGHLQWRLMVHGAWLNPRTPFFFRSVFVLCMIKALFR